MALEQEWQPKMDARSYREEELKVGKDFVSPLVESKFQSQSLNSLQNQVQFLEIRNKGKKFPLTSWLYVYVLKAKGQDGPLIGFSISSKALNAVKRNRVKRVARAMAKQMIQELGASLSFLFLVKGKVSEKDWKSFNQSTRVLYVNLLERIRSQFNDEREH